MIATAEVANGHALAELDAMLEQADVVVTVEVAHMEGMDEAADEIAVTETTVSLSHNNLSFWCSGPWMDDVVPSGMRKLRLDVQ